MSATITKTKVSEMEKGKYYLFEGSFVRDMKKKKTDEKFVMVRLEDNTGVAFARVWKENPIFPSVMELEDEEYVEAEVVCTQHDKYINVEIKTIKRKEKPTVTVVNIEGLKKELRSVLKEYKDEHLYKLVLSVFNRPDINEAYFTSPASQQTCYSFDGGLLAHTVRLIRLCKAVVKVFNEWNHNTDGVVSKLNEDLLITACILHDIGKVKAFTKHKNRVGKTREGELFEDSYLTMRIILEELEKVEIPEYQRDLLEHVIGSSKGAPQFGALFIPRSKEAVVFNLIDTLDTQMAQFEYLKRDASKEQDFAKLFQKVLFLGNYENK